MKFVVFLMVFLSLFAALFTYVSGGLGWNYFPSTVIGIAFYEYTDWLILFHIATGVGLIFFSPETQNRKLMLIALIMFFGSILVNIGSTHIRTDKEIAVKVDNTPYRVSSYENPTIDIEPPYGPSPFRLGGSLSDLERVEVLYFSPKQQFEFQSIFKNEKAKRFFVAIPALNTGEQKTPENIEDSFFIERELHTFRFFPEEPFSEPNSPQRFKSLIEENLTLIEQDITARTVANLNAP